MSYDETKRGGFHGGNFWIHEETEQVMKFEDLEFEEKFDGVQAIVNFRNGFEVSIVKHGGSYGSDKGLYEIGVFDAAGSMCDPLNWGDDVKGWLTPEGVVEELELIQAV